MQYSAADESVINTVFKYIYMYIFKFYNIKILYDISPKNIW